METVRQLEGVESHVRRALSPSGWALVAAIALLGSAVLQLAASLERWVIVSNAWNRSDSTVEDHTFDYYLPADPWENLGWAAQLFGTGFLLLGVGVFAAGRLVSRSGRGIRRFDTWLAAIFAACFVVFGGHALVSGLVGAPTVLQYGYLLFVLGLVQFVGLVVLGVRALPREPLVSLACLVLLAVTAPGYLAATFVVAPVLAGYQSHDTTPWTETVLAVCAAAAAVPLFVTALRRRGHPATGADRERI